MAQTIFQHDFHASEGSNPVDVANQILGYQKALSALYLYVAQTTGMKPDNRYIDAVGLLDGISATIADIKPVLERAAKGIGNH